LKEKLKVDEETLKKTDRYPKDFSCLSSGGEDLCRVKESINEKIHFVECKDLSHCDYRASFGDSYFCTCPTRGEIFNKYGI
jgi:transcription elongation factor Elf1